MSKYTVDNIDQRLADLREVVEYFEDFSPTNSYYPKILNSIRTYIKDVRFGESQLSTADEITKQQHKTYVQKIDQLQRNFNDLPPPPKKRKKSKNGNEEEDKHMDLDDFDVSNFHSEVKNVDENDWIVKKRKRNQESNADNSSSSSSVVRNEQNEQNEHESQNEQQQQPQQEQVLQ